MIGPPVPAFRGERINYYIRCDKLYQNAEDAIHLHRTQTGVPFMCNYIFISLVRKFKACFPRGKAAF